MHVSQLRRCLLDLEKNGHLIRVKEEVDPDLEMAHIQRRAYEQNAPALLFENVKGSKFPCVANLFGSKKRTEYIFRDTLDLVKAAVKIKADPADFFKKAPANFLKNPALYLKLPFAGITSLPKKVGFRGFREIKISDLPQIKSWPLDGGAFITLPQVLSQDPTTPSIMATNLGMYRVQISGGDYIKDKEIGLHYQIHRGIGIHHQKALTLNKPLKVTIFVGGHPAHTVSAVMPLPEGLSELVFAGMLAGRRFRYSLHEGHILSADADFCITGTITNQTKPEGPFGDHLGYYSLTHNFPVLKVDKVFAKDDAIWPFTVVGRPPQEDTSFGELIHDITGPMVPVSLPGVRALHAVDQAGVHPLLLAIGTERYTPYDTDNARPAELLTQANAILGFNQCSLAKYLFITDDESGEIHDIERFFTYLLERVDLTNDLHFQTKTTIDTLDYSGDGLNQGSKLVIAARGKKKRDLAKEINHLSLPSGFHSPHMALPGILVISGPSYSSLASLEMFCSCLNPSDLIGIQLIIVADDAKFTGQNINNFLWVTFTRSSPAKDCYGVESFTEHKHYGCRGPLVIDARIKPHHAPPLEDNIEIIKRVERLLTKGQSLYRILS